MSALKQVLGKNLIGIGLGVFMVVLLVAMPLVLMPGHTFVGSDNMGSSVIRQLAPTYDSSWVRNWWTPPGSETESMLFALQAAAGGMLVGYAFGYFRGRKSAMPANVAASSAASSDESAHE